MKQYRLDYLVAGIILTLFLGKLGEVIQTPGYSITVIEFGMAALYILFAAYLVFVVDDPRWHPAGTALSGVVVLAYGFTAVTRIISFRSLDMVQAAKTQILLGMAATSIVIWLFLLAYLIKRMIRRTESAE